MTPTSTSGTDAVGGENELRCRCGSLLARLSGSALELKCRRCKRIVVVKLRGRMRGAPHDSVTAHACEACGPFEVTIDSD